MAKKDGTFILLKIGGSVFTGLTSNTFNLSIDTIETTTKDSDRHKEYIAGEDDATIDFEALYDPTGTYNLAEVFDAALNKVAISWVFGGTVAGDPIISGEGIINSVAWGAPKGDVSTVNGSIQCSGVKTRGVYADVTAPLLEAAYINNGTPTKLFIQMSEELDASYKPASTVFTIGGVSKTISSYTISGKLITITVSVAFASGDAPTIAYTNPGSGGIRDKSGNELATFTAEVVTNNVSA